MTTSFREDLYIGSDIWAVMQQDNSTVHFAVRNGSKVDIITTITAVQYYSLHTYRMLSNVEVICLITLILTSYSLSTLTSSVLYQTKVACVS